MTDIISVPIAGGGIMILGVATGLDPALMFAEAGGGLWSLSYMSRQSVFSGLHHVSLSVVIAAWLTPAVVGWLAARGAIPATLAEGGARYALALGVGLVAVPVLGRAIMRLARRRLDDKGGAQ